MWLRFTRAASEKRTCGELWHSDRLHLTSLKTPLACHRRFRSSTSCFRYFSQPPFTRDSWEFRAASNRARRISGMQSSVIMELRSFLLFAYFSCIAIENCFVNYLDHSRSARNANTTKSASSLWVKMGYSLCCFAKKRESEDRRTRTKLWMKERRRKCGATSRLDESTKF